jgi:cytoskeletal protein CcmA (bactofilin family)
MGIFSNGTATEGAPSAPVRRRTDGHALSIVAQDMTVTGDLTAEGVVRVEGRVNGNISAGIQVLLSEGALVEGDIKTKEAVLGGEVRGTVTAEDRIEVQATASVHGDLVAPKLLIQEGGRLNGAIRMETVPAE